MSDANSRDSDPLLRALARGDEHCPDGKALARLGRLLRAEAPAPANVSARVVERLALDEAEVTTLDEAAIDRHFNDGIEDPHLDRLRVLMQLPRAAHADVRSRVRRQLSASMRLPPVTAETPVSSRAQADTTAQRTRRLRLIVAVVGLHVAALLAIALMQLGLQPTPPQGGESSGWSNPKPMPHAPEQLPVSWLELPGSGFDLLALRRSPELRTLARDRYHLTGGAGAVTCGLRWILAQQQPDGSFTGRTGSADTQLSTAALATLALLGEGSGSTPADVTRLAAITKALAQLHVEATNLGSALTAATRAKLALVRVEATLLELAEMNSAVAALADLTPYHRELIGDGFAVLAVESALQARVRVDPVLIDSLRSDSLRSDSRAPELGTNPAERVGTAAFSRLTLGWGQNPGTDMLLASLDEHLPTTTLRQPVTWFMPALAAREAGGERWEAWASALIASLVPAFIDTAAGVSCLPITAVPEAPDTVAATAAGVLVLQVGYRYLPTQAR